ncbi:hypothetical protein RRG08_026103 [Elysia crispata]|uniref:Uncharacterized protein n=1 Tax=Elysia crispata TaxID=231223 RepID=A0AAE1D416_9GAST|nr:hypothetical protein RRG08_026103 [Elysia crispata]
MFSTRVAHLRRKTMITLLQENESGRHGTVTRTYSADNISACKGRYSRVGEEAPHQNLIQTPNNVAQGSNSRARLGHIGVSCGGATESQRKPGQTTRDGSSPSDSPGTSTSYVCLPIDPFFDPGIRLARFFDGRRSIDHDGCMRAWSCIIRKKNVCEIVHNVS